MEVSAWARETNLSYKAARPIWKTGKLSLPAEQLATGITIVERPVQTSNVALYGRVSSLADQSEDLEREMQSLRDYVASHGARLYGKLAARRNRVVRARKVLL